jgi:hypothetical protein
MIVKYTCKFCKKTGQVDVEDIPGITLQVEKWRSALCCNRCADYKTSTRGIISQVSKTCRGIEWAPQGKRAEKSEKAKSLLIPLTKRFCTIVCAHFYQPNQWDIEIVNLLTERPEKSADILSKFIHNMQQFIIMPPKTSQDAL